MACRKGMWTLSEMLYWFFYIPMAVVVFIAFVKIPNVILENAVQPVELDAALTKEMLFNRMSVFSYPYGTEFSEFRPANSSTWLFLSPKKFGYMISFKDEKFFGNKYFYLDAKPLAGINYRNFAEVRNGILVDLVYPKKYEFFE